MAARCHPKGKKMAVSAHETRKKKMAAVREKKSTKTHKKNAVKTLSLLFSLSQTHTQKENFSTQITFY